MVDTGGKANANSVNDPSRRYFQRCFLDFCPESCLEHVLMWYSIHSDTVCTGMIVSINTNNSNSTQTLRGSCPWAITPASVVLVLADRVSQFITWNGGERFCRRHITRDAPTGTLVAELQELVDCTKCRWQGNKIEQQKHNLVYYNVNPEAPLGKQQTSPRVLHGWTARLDREETWEQSWGSHILGDPRRMGGRRGCRLHPNRERNKALYFSLFAPCLALGEMGGIPTP